MHFISVVLAIAFVAVANAHFQLQYPPPRGPYVSSLEPTFCDGYNASTSNRTVFPISDGVINLKSGHSAATVGVLMSTVQDPTSFDDFNSSWYQMVAPYVMVNGSGFWCFPINISASNDSAIQEGANVTIQIVYVGGEVNLYQCADLTLSASATIPSNVSSNCTSAVESATPSLPAATATATATATGSSAAGRNMVTITSIAVAVVLASLVAFL